MQVNRLFEIVYVLLDKKTVTAKELAERFEVSQRTIYRDIDILSAAGIPVYTSKGKSGGISLLDNFVLNKSLLSEKEQRDILASLQSLNALKVSDVEPVIQKLAAIFNINNTSWIDIDFSRWGSNNAEREKFNILKNAILNKEVISFDYYSTYGEKTTRTVEPVRLMFKGQGWYLYGFCRAKQDFRLFKIRRIKNLAVSTDTFQREIFEYNLSNSKDNDRNAIKFVIKVEEKMAYRLYDEFEQENITRNSDGSFTVTAEFPEDEWVYGYILSYGNYAEVLEPEYLRVIIQSKLEESIKKYL